MKTTNFNDTGIAKKIMRALVRSENVLTEDSESAMGDRYKFLLESIALIREARELVQ